MPQSVQAIDFMYYVATREFMEQWDRAKQGELICRMERAIGGLPRYNSIEEMLRLMDEAGVEKVFITQCKMWSSVFIWGGPGIGKSSIVAQLAASLKLSLRDIRALLARSPRSQRAALSEDGRSKWAVPEFLPSDGEGILFVDELNAAPGMVQAAFYQLVLDRKLGEYTLLDGWVIIAAGNRESDRAQTSRMPTPLRNRFVHLDFEVDQPECYQYPLRTRTLRAQSAFSEVWGDGAS